MRGSHIPCVLCIFVSIGVCSAQSPVTSRPLGELRRQAFLGVRLARPSESKAGAEVRRVIDAGVAEKTGLRVGDRIIRVNGSLLDGPVTFQRIIPALRAGDTARFEILREGRLMELTSTLEPLPREQLKSVDFIHAEVMTDRGFRLRLIITRPQGEQGKLPAVFLVGWLSCDSVEHPFGPGNDGFAYLLDDIATRSGLVLARVDKPGIGDSEGPSCCDLDFETELAGYRTAFQALKLYDFIDPDRIFILGLSNGGGFAPMVAQNEKVGGYVVAGGWSKTWFEHMMELERRRLRLMGKSHGEITNSMRGYAEFYTDYVVRKMTPRDVLRSKPYLAPLWYELPEHQYGRPASFYHQLQELNLASAWERVEAPTLVLYGEYDWIMSRDDHELIAQIVNSRIPGRATFVELPKTDHGFMAFDSMEKAFNDEPPSNYNTTVTDLVLKFLQSNR